MSQSISPLDIYKQFLHPVYLSREISRLESLARECLSPHRMSPSPETVPESFSLNREWAYQIVSSTSPQNDPESISFTRECTPENVCSGYLQTVSSPGYTFLMRSRVRERSPLPENSLPENDLHSSSQRSPSPENEPESICSLYLQQSFSPGVYLSNESSSQREISFTRE